MERRGRSSREAPIATEEVFETVPTFYPSIEEMRDFEGYLVKLRDGGADQAGLCKIVPPKEWDWHPDIDLARKMRVRNPIQQFVTGRSGVYSVCNVVKKDMVLNAYEEVALSTAKDAPTEFASNESLFDVERRFWKSLTTTAKPPFYGSDVEGSLFGDADVPFNVNKLDCLLKRCGVAIPGITNPMMYVGMWRSFFPFHTEDINMFSINIMHIGAPKFWYGIPPTATKRVENLARSTWTDERCPELMRHKTKMFSPTRLKQAAIPFVRGVQRPRDIMITWPSAFHGGFNAGFNVAEAVNFIPASLLELFLSRARLAGVCKCRPDSVRLDVAWLEERIRLMNTEQERVESSLGDISPVKPSMLSHQRDRKRPLAEMDVKPGETIELSIEVPGGDRAWLPVTVVSTLDGSVRLHQKRTKQANDLWLPLTSDLIRRPVVKLPISAEETHREVPPREPDSILELSPWKPLLPNSAPTDTFGFPLISNMSGTAEPFGQISAWSLENGHS